MIVNLGAIEVDDDTRKMIRRHLHDLAGEATRVEVRAFALAAFFDALEVADAIESDRVAQTA